MTLSSGSPRAPEWWVVSPAAVGAFDGIADFSRALATAIGETAPARLVPTHDEFMASVRGAPLLGVFLQYSPPAFVQPHVVPLLAALSRLRRSGVPVVTTVHEYWPPASSSIKRGVWRRLCKRVLSAVASRSSCMVATTPFADDHLRRSGVFGRTPSRVIPVGSNIVPAPRTPHTEGPITFAMFGQPYVMDRAVVLGFTRWLASLPAAQRPRLVWAARSDDEVRRWWREVGAPDVVDVRGGLSSPDVAELLARADVGLAFYDDGVSTRRSGFTAMAATGLPIVGLHGRFTDDRLKACPGLLLSPIGDANALVSNAQRVVDDAALRERLALGTAELYRADLTWSRIAGQYLSAARP